MKNNLLFAILVMLLWGTAASLADHDDDDDDHDRWGTRSRKVESYRQLQPAMNAAWKAECGSCHTLYHPGLLPARSWAKIMTGLKTHFGENAELEPKVEAEITKFLVINSGDHAASKRSKKVMRTIPAQETPLRISTTAYFVRKHDEISPATWKRKGVGSPANCGACHPQADQGSFSEHEVRIPQTP